MLQENCLHLMIIAMNLNQIVQLTAVLLTGLVAGLFYSYACSITNGLGKLSDRSYILAFQSVNKAILNPWFFAPFLGSLIILPVSAWLSYKADSNTVFWLLLAATMVYSIGVFGVTIFGNVPLNNLLEHFDEHRATDQAFTSLRENFEDPWNHLHVTRTVASVLSFLLTILSIIKA